MGEAKCKQTVDAYSDKIVG